jgi:aldehyde dehydrogenase (NAD+)
MQYSQEATKATQQKMEAAIENKDFPAFNSAYMEFLKQFDSFNQSLSAGPTQVQSHNAIFGRKGFFLQQTNNEQAKQLLANARAASKVMESVPLADRLEFLGILEEKITKYQEAIMTTITADTGKPIELSKGEMSKGKEWFDYARDEVEKQLGQKHVGKIANRMRPQGAVQVIGAYNYPYALAIGGIVGSLAAGNGAIVSAPLKAPNWVFPFMQAAREAVQEFADKAKSEGKPYADELTKNISNLIQYSVGVNTNLTSEADVVHFVGGDTVGEIIRNSRGRKTTILEMGGSNVITIMKSALNNAPAEKIADTIYAGFGPATGQRCTAPRFLCVQNGAEAVAEALKSKCDVGPKPDEIGNPFKQGIKMGPLVDRGAHQKMKEAIALAKELGATVHGRLEVSNNIVPLASAEDSYWVNPIVIDWSGVDITNAENARKLNDCFKDEIFGPLVHIVHPVQTLDQAIATTKHLDSHGLAAAIFTNDPQDVEHYAHEVSVTSLAVNGAPKDQSPRGPHGHPGLATIGGDSHFGLYSSRAAIASMR